MPLALNLILAEFSTKAVSLAKIPTDCEPNSNKPVFFKLLNLST